MSFGRRWWRVMRGLGRSAAGSLRRSERGSQPLQDSALEEAAWAEAKAEVEAGVSPPPAGLAGIPGEIGPEPLAAEPAPTRPGVARTEAGMAGTMDPSLAPHYETLGLPAGADMERVEHAYRQLKERWNPQRHAADPIEQARARQQDARLDEAYLALKRALVRERRL